MRTKILYIEDEPDLGNVTKQYLELMEFEVEWHRDSDSAYKSFINNNFNISIIDIGLPGLDGFSLAKQFLAHNNNAYFIFLTARNLKEDKIAGLKMGAIDYITKPFDVDELVLRIKNIVSKQSQTDNSSEYHTQVLRSGDVSLDLEGFILSVNDDFKTTITQREVELFKYFFENSNKVIDRKELLLTIWGKNDYFLGRSLDVFISRLRKLIATSKTTKIENIYGVGFMFVVTPTPEDR